MPTQAALTEKQQRAAARLYTKGFSAKQVADHFGISIDASYYTLRKLKVPRRSTKETNKIRFEAKPLSYALKTNLNRREKQLKVTAVMLYWAEGYKAGNGSVDFANSDPDMVLIFWKFLSEICGVSKNRVRLHLYAYAGQDVSGLKRFWANLLGLSEEAFVKPYIKKAQTPGPRGPRMIHGLVHVRYSDKKLFEQIIAWIDEYRMEMVG